MTLALLTLALLTLALLTLALLTFALLTLARSVGLLFAPLVSLLLALTTTVLEDPIHRLTVVGAVGRHAGALARFATAIRGVTLASLISLLLAASRGALGSLLLAFGLAAPLILARLRLPTPLLRLPLAPRLTLAPLSLLGVGVRAFSRLALLPGLRLVGLLAILLLAVGLLLVALRLFRSVGRLRLGPFARGTLPARLLAFFAATLVRAILPLWVAGLVVAIATAVVARVSPLVSLLVATVGGVAPLLLVLLRVVGKVRLLLIGARRGLRVDFQFLPLRHRDVGLRCPVVGGDCPVLDHPPGLGAWDSIGLDPSGSLEWPLLDALQNRNRRCGPAAIEPGLDDDLRKAVIGIERPDPHRHRRVARHRQRRLRRRLDRDLGGQIGDHLDAVLHRLGHHRFAPPLRRAAGLENETVGGVFRRGVVAVHAEWEGDSRTGEVTGADFHPQVAMAIAPEIDPRRLDRLVAFRHERDLRLLRGPQITLPGDRVGRLPRVGRIVVAHLTDEERGRIDNHDPQRFTAGVSGEDRQLHGIIEATGGIGEERRERLARIVGGAARHLHPPRRGRRIGRAVFSEGHGMDDRLFPAAQAADRGGEHELSAADDPGGPSIDRHVLPVGHAIEALRIDRRAAGHPPVEAGRIDPHPRGSGEPRPRHDEPGGADKQALRRRQLVDAGQADERRQSHRHPHRERAIDDRVGGDIGQPLGGPLLERTHHDRRAPLGMGLDEHGVDEVVVEFGVLPFDRPGGIDEVDAIPHQREQPTVGRRGE